MATKDATVNAKMLMDVGTEISGRPLEETARRLNELEPVLIAYINATADRVAGRLANSGVEVEHARHVAMELRKVGFTVMRAQGKGYYRLWKNTFAPEVPENDSKTP